MPNPKLSLIVLNWNGKQFLETCFHSIAEQTYPRSNFETILVDNGSTDGSVDYAKQHFPLVRILALPKNVGFAKGNNYGMFHAKGEWVLTLNNDTKLDPDCLYELMQAINRDEASAKKAKPAPRIGMYAIKMRFFYEPDELNSTGTLIYRDGAAMNRSMREKDNGQYDDPSHADIFGPCAGAGVSRKKMLAEIAHPPTLAEWSEGKLGERSEAKSGNALPTSGNRRFPIPRPPQPDEKFMRGVPEYFDAAFFIYLEDVDLIWRAQLAGWKARYIPKALLYHVHSATMEAKSPKKLYLAERNRIWYTFKVFPLRTFLVAPWYTLKRYCAIRKSLGKTPHVSTPQKYSVFQLCAALCKAWWDGLLGLPKFWGKRRQIQRSRKLSPPELKALFRKYGATVRQIARS